MKIKTRTKNARKALFRLGLNGQQIKKMSDTELWEAIAEAVKLESAGPVFITIDSKGGNVEPKPRTPAINFPMRWGIFDDNHQCDTSPLEKLKRKKEK